ncbi:MAG: sigma-70 family RNA polymerase sigma factor [Verrucomicrobiae bacterium]|nr:sigma-70 family RNA polymerase sigma factor [Verrucomicrobiae bacterium]NNJ86353.1 sigma-70 family RNA polymerase sigma factor [Akkermansiaceae bacterium]
MIDEKTFIRLFVRHEAELRGFAVSLVPSVDDALDVLQDACIAMWQRIDSLDNQEGFVPWAYTFVRLTALNRIRQLRRSKLVFSEELVELNAEEAGQESERSRAELQSLRECMDQLQEKQLELIQRYYAAGKTRMADLSREMDRPVAGLYKALERIRTTLRECIDQKMTDRGF